MTDTDEASESVKALLGEEVVRTSFGESFHVRPWGVRTGRRMVGRIKTILMILRATAGGDVDLGGLLESSFDEIVMIVADSCDLTMEEMEDDKRFLLEDLVVLATAVIKVNFTERPGALAKMNALGAQIETMFGPSADDEETSVPSLTPTETPTTTETDSPKP